MRPVLPGEMKTKMKTKKPRAETKKPEVKRTQIVVEEGGADFVTPRGRLLARLSSLQGGGAAFALFGPSENGYEVMVAATGEFAAVSVHQPSGLACALLGNENGGRLNIHDKADGWTASVWSSPDGGQIEARRASGPDASVPVARLGGTPDGGQMLVASPDGAARAGMTVQPQGGLITVLSADDQRAVDIGAAEGGGGAVRVNNQAGAAIFLVPMAPFPPGTTLS